MWLRAPAACPEWNVGIDEDAKVLQWLSIHTGLTSECVSEIIELFTKQQAENATTGMTWNEAEKHAAERQVMQPPPHPAKVVELNTMLLSGAFEQYTLLDQLADAEAWFKPLDNAMIIDEPAKPVAGSSKHPDNVDIVDSELIY